MSTCCRHHLGTYTATEDMNIHDQVKFAGQWDLEEEKVRNKFAKHLYCWDGFVTLSTMAQISISDEHSLIYLLPTFNVTYDC